MSLQIFRPGLYKNPSPGKTMGTNQLKGGFILMSKNKKNQAQDNTQVQDNTQARQEAEQKKNKSGQMNTENSRNR